MISGNALWGIGSFTTGVFCVADDGFEMTIPTQCSVSDDSDIFNGGPIWPLAELTVPHSFAVQHVKHPKQIVNPETGKRYRKKEFRKAFGVTEAGVRRYIEGNPMGEEAEIVAQLLGSSEIFGGFYTAIEVELDRSKRVQAIRHFVDGSLISRFISFLFSEKTHDLEFSQGIVWTVIMSRLRRVWRPSYESKPQKGFKGGFGSQRSKEIVKKFFKVHGFFNEEGLRVIYGRQIADLFLEYEEELRKSLNMAGAKKKEIDAYLSGEMKADARQEYQHRMNIDYILMLIVEIERYKRSQRI